MGSLTKHLNVMMRSDMRYSGKAEEFDKVQDAMQLEKQFVGITDPFDDTPIFLKVSEIEAISVWTEHGQTVWAEHQERIKEINEAKEKPDWQ